MPSSDSEDFESADEGSNTQKGRKHRTSSSNYSDNALENEPKIQIKPTLSKDLSKSDAVKIDGWDDWGDTNLEETTATNKLSATNSTKSVSEKATVDSKSEDTGWDNFGDWGSETNTENDEKQQQPIKSQPTPDIKEVTERLAATSTNSGGWGWGWGVDSLLSTATAAANAAAATATTLTSHVSQGISTVLETGIGAPDPEELARKSAASKENEPKPSESEVRPGQESSAGGDRSGDAFAFGGLLSGVTKFVESTGTKVLAGGLDTLETIGKKTMEVLQDGDPGLAKKKAMLGLNAGDQPVLSQVLREAKTKADEEDKRREEKREAKELHYENLFDDFEGLVHLEALEMLSRQVSMRIEERMRGANSDKRQDMKETMQQVAELCEMPEEEDEDDEESSEESKPDALHERLQTATQDLGLKLQFQPIVKQYTEILTWLSTAPALTGKCIYKRAVSSLAQTTALSVEVYHKAAEMLLVKTRRSTADEADALTQMTVVLTKHISDLATLFTEKLNSITTDDKDQVNTFITNIFLEAGNSSTYVQNAFQLALPILQIGAV